MENKQPLENKTFPPCSSQRNDESQGNDSTQLTNPQTETTYNVVGEDPGNGKEISRVEYNVVDKLSKDLSETNKKFSGVPLQWQVTKVNADAIRKVNLILTSVRGASKYSRLPLRCRGEKCHYRDSCYIESLGIKLEDIEGQMCPIESAEIVTRFNDYLTEFDVDPEDREQTTLTGLIKELVDCDILIMRAEAAIQADGHFLEDRVVGISADGAPIKNKEISKNFEFKAKIEERKNKVLQLLNATPKDKAGSKVTITMDPASYASDLMAKLEEEERSQIIEGEYKEIE